MSYVSCAVFDGCEDDFGDLSLGQRFLCTTKTTDT